MPQTETKARLTLRGREVDTGTWQAMNAKRNEMVRNGYPRPLLEVHNAVALGVFYCKTCDEKVKDPENYFYNGHEYWKCKCQQINYIS